MIKNLVTLATVYIYIYIYIGNFLCDLKKTGGVAIC